MSDSPREPSHKSPDQTHGKPYRPGRSDFRNRSHQSAHDESASASQHPQPPIHPLIPRGDAQMVDNAHELDALIAHLRSAGRFAYDSEFIGEMTYIPKLCLIQVASAEKVALIDPLEPIDLVPFWEVICDGSVEKIVHAGAQDLEPVFRHLNCPPANVFDTQT